MSGSQESGLAGTKFLAAAHRRWHPVARSLLDRAHRAGQRLDRPHAERIIHELSEERARPVIKWTDTPGGAFEHLLRYSLSDLAQMPTARLWRSSPPLSDRDPSAEARSIELYLYATDVLRVEERGRALMAPKLAFKAQATQSHPGLQPAFEARAIAAEIGWIETSLSGAAAAAIRAVEDFLSTGHSEGSMAICHQLRAFEAFECGLLATCETPQELICLPIEARA
jgi:hypothetical protein